MNNYENSNVTIRRRRSKSASYNHDVSLYTDPNLDGSCCSEPLISDDEDENISLIQKLKSDISSLTLKLGSANDKIDSLIIENNQLRKINDELLRDNNLLKEITNNPIKTTTPNSKTRAREQKNNEQYKDAPSIIPNCNTIKQKTEKNIIRTLPQDNHNKICIISSNPNILPVASTVFQKTHKICHYLTQNIGIGYLLKNLEDKIKGYNFHDYCVIIFGEEDFKTTCNYFELVYKIRETLLRIKHTNIILAPPTYKLGPHFNIFNTRVETFSNLLYLNNLTYNFAYIVDSNYNLSCDFSMFRRSGTLNKLGIETILNDILNIMTHIAVDISNSSSLIKTADEESVSGMNLWVGSPQNLDEEKSRSKQTLELLKEKQNKKFFL